jgi:hypothetical protein
LHSLAAAISGRTGKLARLDTVTLMAMADDFRDSGELIEPRAPESDANPLQELEHLLGILRAEPEANRT